MPWYHKSASLGMARAWKVEEEGEGGMGGGRERGKVGVWLGRSREASQATLKNLDSM